MVMAYFYKYVNPSQYGASTSEDDSSDPNETTSLMDDMEEERTASTIFSKMEKDFTLSTESTL